MNKIIITFISILIVFSGLLFYSCFLPQNSYLNRIIMRISVLVTLMVAMGVYILNTILSQKKKIQDISYNVNATTKSWVLVNKKFVDYSNECPEFISSLIYDWQRKVIQYNHNKKKENDNWAPMMSIVINIIQGIEDVITASKISNIDEESFLTIVITWMHSKKMREIWKLCRPDYAFATQKYLDYIIEVSSKFPQNNKEDVKKIVNYLLKDKKFLELKNKK